jgi:LAO/AO transport system kinase
VVTENGYFQANRNNQARFWMYETIDEQLRQGFYHAPAVKEMLGEMERRVMNVEISSFEAARQLLEIYRRD